MKNISLGLFALLAAGCGADPGVPDAGDGALAGLCGEGGFCWQNPLPQGEALHAVRVGASSTVAVGDRGTILRRDGAGWRRDPSPTARALRGLWGADDAHLFAVGDGGTILRFDGAAWTAEASGAAADLRAVWGAARDAVFAVGDGGTALRFDGAGWRAESVPDGAALAAVAGSSASDVWAAGDGALYRRAGAAWTRVPLDGAPTVRALYLPSAGDGWAAASDGLYRRDVTGWRRFDARLTDVRALAGVDAAHVFGVGGAGLFVRWDGAAWRTGPGSDAEDLFAVGAGAPDDLWLVGDGGNLVHSDGARATVGWAAAVRADVTALAGSGPRDVWAGLAAGRRLAHFDGAAWSEVWIDPLEAPVAVWSAAPDDAFLATATGALARFDGHAWAMQRSGLPPLRALGGASRDDLFAVGDAGAVLHFDGAAWAAEDAGTTRALAAVAGARGTAWAVGAAGTCLHRVDGQWVAVDAGAGADDLDAVVLLATGEVLLLGGGRLYRGGDGAFASEPLPPGAFHRLWGAGADDLWAVGDDGAVAHRDAGGWSLVDAGTGKSLAAAWGSDGELWIGGAGGAILHRAAR